MKAQRNIDNGTALPGILQSVRAQALHWICLIVAAIALGLAVAALVVACEQTPIMSPTGGFACGPQAQQCPGGGCCSLSEECGGLWPNCPRGYCCANEDDGRVWGLQRRPERVASDGGGS